MKTMIKWWFAWLRLSIEGEADGGGSTEGGDGGGGEAAPEDGAPDTGTGAGGDAAAAGEKDAGGGKKDDAGDGKPADTGPKTMLEAIGRGLSKEGEGQPDKSDDGKGPAKSNKDKANGKVDEQAELLKMPEGLSAIAQQRFQKLVGDNKALTQQQGELNQKLTEAQGTLTDLKEEMHRTGATPDDLNTFFTFKEAITGGKYDEAEKILLSQLKALQLATGRATNFDGANVLSDFPDLQQDVTDLKITPERAMEIAKGRNQTKQAEAARLRQDEAARNDGAKEAARTAAINAVQKWANEQATADIDYKAKEGKILAKLKTIAQTYPPSLWLTRIKEAYTELGEVVTPKPNNEGKDNALRGGVGGGGGKPAPKTMGEAIGAGLNWS